MFWICKSDQRIERNPERAYKISFSQDFSLDFSENNQKAPPDDQLKI